MSEFKLMNVKELYEYTDKEFVKRAIPLLKRARSVAEDIEATNLANDIKKLFEEFEINE